MSSAKLKLAVAVVAALVLAIILIDERRVVVKARAETRSLRDQALRMAELVADELDLTSLKVGSHQREELTRLREEVAALRAEKQRWPRRATGSRGGAEDYYPLERWDFVGYTKPDASIETMLWAAWNRDPRALLNSLPPQAYWQSAFEWYWNRDEFKEGLKTNTLEATMANTLMKAWSSYQSFRILEHTPLAEDRMVVTARFESDNDQGGIFRLKMRRVDGDWKFDGFMLSNGSPLLPGVQEEGLKWSDGVTSLGQNDSQPTDPSRRDED